MRGKKFKSLLIALMIFGILPFLLRVKLDVKAQPLDEWWNASWRYRVKLEVNSSYVNRTNWIIELNINFTQLLEQRGDSGTFDLNSTRVIEYNSSGSPLYEVPSQFDKGENFDASSNAYGTLVFVMNGTTPANEKRIYYIYFDIVENGVKDEPNYLTQLVYGWDGEEVNVNTSSLRIYIDTNRGDYTSGIYRVDRTTGEVIINEPTGTGRTIEYIEYSNGTHNFTFDLRNNATIIAGPIRVLIEQEGEEVIFGNPDNKTGKLRIKKRYYIYETAGPNQQGSYIKIEQQLLPIALTNRNSTPAGALALDLDRGIFNGISSTTEDTTDPYSWVLAAGPSAETVGVVNLKEINTTNYFAISRSNVGRIGIELNNTTIQQPIYEMALVYFGLQGGDEFDFIRKSFSNPVEISLGVTEEREVRVEASTDHTIYNRGEEVYIYANITYDPFNLVQTVNATLDRGTADTSDDITLILYDDGTHGDEVANDKIYTNVYTISTSDLPGKWNVTISVYGEGNALLAQNFTSFNVSDEYLVYVKILNKYGLAEREVKAYVDVKNYRNDTFIPGATLNCTYDGSYVTNYVDYNNGTYFVNFTAPSEPGWYTLNCTAEKLNNSGYGTDTFRADTDVTYLSIEVSPKNYTATTITWYVNESFEAVVNITNIWEGTAYDTNITLELPSEFASNSTLEYCGLLAPDERCVKAFLITVRDATPPGYYLVNLTVNWRNTNGSIWKNETYINVSVTSNPQFYVPEEKIENVVAKGKNSILGNFTLNSTGNDEVLDIVFNVIGLDDFIFNFTPLITSLPPGKVQSIQVNVTVPRGYPSGTYTGTLNVTSSNAGFDTLTLNITVSGTNVSIEVSPKNYTATTINSTNSESFIVYANATNLGNVSAFNSNITLELPSGWLSNSTYVDCGDISPNETCFAVFNVTIPNLTPSGNYLINISVNWEDIGSGFRKNETYINVTVTSNVIMEIPETNVTNSVSHGRESILGNITIKSLGNDPIENLEFNVIGLDDFEFEFIPLITSLPAGSIQPIQINITVPYAYEPGTYTGTLNVTSSNAGYKEILMNVTIFLNRTWTMYPQYCEHPLSPLKGVVCTVVINNTGNAPINFTITPKEGNYTYVNITNFTVERNSSFSFDVYYDATDAPYTYHNSTFTVNATQPDADPDYLLLKVVLTPYAGPFVEKPVLLPDEIEQDGRVEIYVNVTDRSGVGLEWVKVNVTRPDGLTDEIDMSRIALYDEKSTWYALYSSSNGDTTIKGEYNVTVYAKDKVNLTASNSSTFKVYTKFRTFLATYKEEYHQGETGSIYCRIIDWSDDPLKDVNVTLYILDPSSNITYLDRFVTNEDGVIYPLPQFSIASDALLGNYTLVADLRYFDSIVNRIITSNKTYMFSVEPGGITGEISGLFVDLETTVVWYPDNVMKFVITVYDAQGLPIDPDNITLTVYDPAENVYFKTSKPNMTREAKGLYSYKYAMPTDTATGAYFAVVNVSQDSLTSQRVKAFRVSSGGPYDVRIRLLETEVPPGDTLDFEIILINMGEVSQDVDVDYWDSSPDGTVWYFSSEAVYVPALSNKTLLRSVYIFSNQPEGIYYLNVKVTYDVVQPPIHKNVTFRVSRVAAPPPAPAPAPPALPVALLEMYGVKDEINIEAGWTKYMRFFLNNTGGLDIHNIKIRIIGIPTTWFTLTPDTINLLHPGKGEEILLELKVPEGEKRASYEVTILATSDETSVEKNFTLNVFTSKLELLSYEIESLERKLLDLKTQTEAAEREGKDVSAVKALIDEIEEQIALAKFYLKERKLDECTATILVASNLITKAFFELSRAPKIKVVAIPTVPLWVFLAVVLFLLSILVLVVLILVLRKRIFGLGKVARPHVEEVRALVGRVREKREVLEAERRRIKRLIDLLEREVKEGLISEKTYLELKARHEAKLREIEEKLGGKG